MSSLGIAVSKREDGQTRAPSRIRHRETMPAGLPFLSRRAAKGSPAALRPRSDGELVALAQERNADAFEVIYDRHSTAAYSLAYRLCGTHGMAEDVVQEAFLSLWRRLDRYDSARGELRSWLLGIVRNSAIDRLRHNRVHDARRASTDGIEDRLEASERTDLEVEQREQATDVRRALQALPAEQRRVIELAYFDGLTHTQIASVLDMPVGTIKGRMRLGLAKLATLLAAAREATSNDGKVAL